MHSPSPLPVAKRSAPPVAARMAPALLGLSAALGTCVCVCGYLGARSLPANLLALLAVSTLLQLSALALMLRGHRNAGRRERVGRYELRECLGCGGMGEVWRAFDLSHRREVAVKLLRAHRAQPVAVRRFEREIWVTRSLTHPNTVALYDFGVTTCGDHFYAMELLQGESLGTLLGRAGPLSWQRAAAFARSVAGTLAEVHAQGVVHRDLKPDNLFVTREEGPRGHLKLLDFGVASVLEGAGSETLTRDSCVAGTPSYLAPEVASGQKAVPASDIYALGVVMYRMLTGRLPYAMRSSSAVSQLFIHATLPSVPPSQYVSLPAPLEAVVLRCLQKDPQDRYPHAGALAQALDALALSVEVHLGVEPSGVRAAPEPVTSATPLLGHPREAFNQS